MVAGLQCRDFIGVVADTFSDPVEDAAAFGGIGVPPVRERLASSLDGTVDVRLSGDRHLRKHVACRWVDGLDVLAALGYDALAADQQVVSR